MASTSSSRICRVTLVLLVLALPVLGPAAWQATQHAVNSPADWMPLSFPARGQYEQFRLAFESGDVAIVAWQGCTVDDPRLETFVAKLEAAPEAHPQEAEPWFERILAGNRTLAKLTGEPLKLPRAEVLRRLRGSLVGSDLLKSCAVVVFSNNGLYHRAEAVELIQRTLEHDCGVPRDKQHLAGPIIDGVNVDRASQQSLEHYAIPAALIILALGWWCLRSLRVELLVFSTALYCVLATLALIHFCGDKLNAVLIVMPPLVLVLGVSGGIHLVNYLYDAREHGGRDNLARRAIALGWLPCALSAGTTAMGMASLLVSDVLPVRQFGLYAAFGVSLTFVLLLAVLPGAFEIWPSLAESRAKESANHITPLIDHHDAPPHAIHPPLAHPTLDRHVQQWANPITVVSVILMVAATIGVPNIVTSVRIQTLFGAKHRVLTDYEWLERHIGPLVPIEMLVRFDPSCQLNILDRAELVRGLTEQLQKMPEVGGTMSAVTFLPELSTSGGAQQVARRTVMRRAIERHVDELFKLRYLHRGDEGETWRITARVSALKNLDYGNFLDEVHAVVEPALAERRKAGAQGLSASYTGVMPLVHEVQRALLNDLFSSFLTAFGTITVVMMLVERGILAGLVSMIPNVFPMVLMFGFLGWWAFPMDIGSVMTASVALGMAIDGTLHYLTFYQRGLQRGFSSSKSVELAFRQCSGAMTQSTIVCGFGVLVFALSSFLPTSRFAVMMLILLWLALAGDLVVLPALLLGPCGRFFRPRRRVMDSSPAVEPTLLSSE
ncbi:MAG: MMPL family transporter [Planctomycetes bacterium]|nr:MMPL family transporter [Planctomycetota bacterium]